MNEMKNMVVLKLGLLYINGFFGSGGDEVYGAAVTW